MESSDPPPVFAPTISSSPASSPILFDTFLLLLLRLIYFFISRKFLHSTINPTLRDISQPETILPSTVSIPTADSSRRGGVASVNETEYYEETDDTGFTPVSSYPGSPAPISLTLTSSSNGSRRDDNPGYSSSSLPSYPSQGENTIELQAVGQKLKDASSGVSRKVLQLSHGKRSGAGTKRVKKATRGLHRASRILFSVCFAEGCNLISLVIFHAIGVLNARSRQVNFSVSLHFILALILVVVPLVQCLLFTYRSRDSSSTSTTPSQSSSLSFTSRLLISLIPFTLYMFLFTRIPPYITAVPVNFQVVPTPSVDMDDPSSTASTIDEAIVQWSTSGPEGWEQGGWLAPSLGRVVVLGVVILGSLSGFGAVRSAWNFFEHRRAGSHMLTDNDLLQAERSLYRVRQDLISKKDEINRYVVPSGESSSGWMGRIFGVENNQTAALEAELRGLETMEMQVSRSLKAMKARKRRQDFGHTFRGQIYNILGYVFAVYCAARLLMCLPSLFFAPHTAEQESGEVPIEGKGNTNGDWISFFLALAISKLPRDFADIDVPTWSRGISLILTGVLILSSLTQVMRSLSKILRLTSKTVGAGFLLLSLGQLFATYVISLLIQLRTSLPPTLPESDPFSNHGNYTGMDYDDQSSIDLSQRDDSLLSTLPDFRVFGRLFDIMFLLAAATTALYRYIVLKVASADDMGDIYT
ncbi:hypothetical protein I314_04688 [Cryptococcus bacillisporus CA1873]|uniref:Abscisic acid G-protein coupled receptor-domain-containing protein n=1 Tax=Cryptococcus bacillisporus CA1873 TaxID=1296111 RepID=A0ABR5B904_CRYGA|nr:hypothetical protein I314_04688 [Cryptococcus bacillisporus CA1873]|eukprot:KIR59692.1 hypothetical protein I314_04688 [Cryptococcus gattii CA1873]